MTKLVDWSLIVAGVALVVVEVALGAASGFDFLLIGSALLVGGVLGLIVGSASLGVATAGVLSLLYVLVGRRRIRRRLLRPGILSNTDALLGRLVRVSEDISQDRPGRVHHEGEEWRAALDSPSAPALLTGRMVRVHRIDGVTLYVVPDDPPPERSHPES